MEHVLGSNNIFLSGEKTPGMFNQPWNVCSCDRIHGRICSGDSTSSPYSRPPAALMAPSRSDERVHNTLDRTTTETDKQW